jgi:peptide deformylase
VTILAVLEYPDPRLRTKAERVVTFDSAFDRFVDDLVETMHAARAVGLAATQVDVHLRVIVADVSPDGSAPEVFVNPEVVSRDRPGLVEESCLSLPGLLASVGRATRLTVRAQGRDGAPFTREVEGLLAVCIQHELDHLEGVLFLDHLSFFRRALARRGLASRALARRRKPGPKDAAA